MGTKKRYNVRVESTSYYDMEVEAESEDEAWDIGKEADGGEFVEDGIGSWDIIRIEVLS